VKDLTPFIEKEGGPSSGFRTSIQEASARDGEKKVLRRCPKNMVAMVIVYNAQLFREAGSEHPRTETSGRLQEAD